MEKEEQHIKQALKMCQYPDWTFNKTKERMEAAKARGKNTKRNDKTEPGSENRGILTLPYIKGVTECVQKVMHKYRIQAPVKPHLKLRNLLVHPKDKIETAIKCNVIYELDEKIRTRSVAQETKSQCLKSAVSENCNKENHLVNWEECKIKFWKVNPIRKEDD